jgi:hypothetical protein
MKSIVILHFRPPKLYPPLLNFISFLDEKKISYKLITAEKYNSKSNLVVRIYFVFSFFFRGNFSTLLRKRPIICIESISSIGLFASNYINRKQKVYLHYHEYFSIEEYKSESLLERLGHKLERIILKRALWISHTNEDRLKMWAGENQNIKPQILRLLPNYPPSKWLNSTQVKKSKNNIIKLVHIGSLSTKSMYLKEVLSRFGSNCGFTIDFYSHQFTQDVIDAIKPHNNCIIHGSIDYFDIPKLKGVYDVGLVMYKGLSLNVKYSAPNKIFEYLALGLDVWCSDKLVSAENFQRIGCYPKMIMVDFTNLELFDVEQAKSIEGLSYVPSPYTFESIFTETLKHLKS